LKPTVLQDVKESIFARVVYLDQVVTGNLSLGENSLSSPLSVAAGMCLLPVDGLSSKAIPFSRLQSGACQQYSSLPAPPRLVCALSSI